MASAAPQGSRLWQWTYTALRYFVAFGLAGYGFAKLFDAQFTVFESQLDRPMGDVSGMTLVWYFFGYSKVYGTLIALSQILGAVLLVIPAAALTGALLLFVILTNILVVDLTYGVNASGTNSAIVLWSCTVLLLWHHRRTLLRAGRELGLGGLLEVRPAWTLLKVGLVLLPAAAMILATVKFNNTLPTPIDGSWDLVSGQAEGVTLPKRVYFEKTRRNLAIFRYLESSRPYHFEVDPERRTVSIWSGYPMDEATKPDVLSAEYTLEGDQLELRGSWGPNTPAVLRFSRAKQRTLPPAG